MATTDSFAQPDRNPAPAPNPAAQAVAAPPLGGAGNLSPMPMPPPELLQALAMFAHHLHGAQQQMPHQMPPQAQGTPSQGQGMPQQGQPPAQGMPNTILGQSIGNAMQPPQMPAAQVAAQAGQTPGHTGGAAPPPGSLNKPGGEAPMPHRQPQPLQAPSQQGAMPPGQPAPQLIPQQQPPYKQTQTYHQPTMTQMQATPMPAFPGGRPVAGVRNPGK